MTCATVTCRDPAVGRGDQGSRIVTARLACPSARPAPDAQAEAAPPAAERQRTTKYTATLDDETAVAFDELALVARRKLGRLVDKSELLRALVLLASDDASLREEIISKLPARSLRGPKRRGSGSTA